MHHVLPHRPTAARIPHLAALLCALVLAGCGTARLPGQLSDVAAPAANGRALTSTANSAAEYRRDAAQHVYNQNAGRIYRGQLPPLLYAVGTLQVRLDGAGQVSSLHWLRAPQHAPDAIAGIERTVLAAAPYPVSARLGPVTWTDTWLWDKSGRFQLDTLTEGQLQAAP